jgi:uroporphyrinogen III methyltransferase/synthase
MVKPLQNLNILLTRTRIGVSKLKAALEDNGAVVYELKTCQHNQKDCYSLYESVFKEINNFNVVVISSTKALQIFDQLIKYFQIDLMNSYTGKIIAMADMYSKLVLQNTHKIDLLKSEILKREDIDDIETFVSPLSHILYINAEIERPALRETLKNKTVIYKEIALFEITPCHYSNEEQEKIFSKVDLIIFPSSMNVEKFFSTINRELLEKHREIKSACMGKQTQEMAKHHGLEIDIISKEPSISSLVETLIDYYQ